MQILKQKLIAGADWNFEESVSGYSSADYDLKYRLKRGTNEPFDLDSVDKDSGFEFNIDATETADLPAGFYSYQAFAILKTDSTEIIPLETGIVQVVANIGTATDARSFALQMVEKYRTLLLLLADQSYDQIALEDGKTLTLKDIQKVRQELSIWESKAGLGFGGRVRKIKFTNNFE